MTEETKYGISRRTLAKGAAWSVPAVAVAAAAPAYAASPTFTFQFGTACKETDNPSGNSPTNCFKHYYVPVKICNTGNAGSITITSWDISGTTNDDLIVVSGGLTPGTTVQFTAGECKEYEVWMKGATTNNLANGTATFTISYTYTSAGKTITADASVTYGELNPCSQYGGVVCTVPQGNNRMASQEEGVDQQNLQADEPSVTEKPTESEPATEPKTEEIKETAAPVAPNADEDATESTETTASDASSTETVGEETVDA